MFDPALSKEETNDLASILKDEGMLHSLGIAGPGSGQDSGKTVASLTPKAREWVREWQQNHPEWTEDDWRMIFQPSKPTITLPKLTSDEMDLIHQLNDAQRMYIVVVARITVLDELVEWRQLGRLVELDIPQTDEVVRRLKRANLALNVRGGIGKIQPRCREVAKYLESQIDENRQRHVLKWWAFKTPDFPFDAPGCRFKDTDWDKIRLLCAMTETAAQRNRATTSALGLARLLMISEDQQQQLLDVLETDGWAIHHDNGQASVTLEGQRRAVAYEENRRELISQGYYLGGHPGPIIRARFRC
jgi:hypothetical protein